MSGPPPSGPDPGRARRTGRGTGAGPAADPAATDAADADADRGTVEPGAAEAPAENRLFRWLEGRLFPAIIAYTVHPIHILALLILWMLLLVLHAQVFELVGGNYTNGLSAMAASIVLLQQTRHQRQARRHLREHGELLRRLHERLDRLDGTDHHRDG